MPFKHAIIGDILRSQWFGKGKADILTTTKIVSVKKVMGPIIVLIVTVVRNAQNSIHIHTLTHIRSRMP